MKKENHTSKKQKKEETFFNKILLYLIFYPFATICGVIYLFRDILFTVLLRIKDIYENILKPFKKVQIQILLGCIDFVCGCLILRLSNTIVIMSAMVILIVLLKLHFVFLFQLITNPMMAFNPIFLQYDFFYIPNKENVIVKKYFDKKNKTKDLKILEKIKKDLKASIIIYAKAFNRVNNRIKDISNERALLKFFVTVFIITVVFTIIVFSFEYYGLAKINIEHFSLLKVVQYFEYFYFSISIYSTIDSDITPLTTCAKSIVIVQILVGIFLFYIFILSFSTIAFKSALKDREKMLNKIEKILNYLDDVAKNELNTNIANLLQEK